MPESLTPSDLLALIARHRALEARLTAKHARCYEEGAQASLAIGRLAPAPQPYHMQTDPHYWTRVRAGQWIDRGNEAIQRAQAVAKKRKGLEKALGVLEARSAVKTWADPFREVACA